MKTKTVKVELKAINTTIPAAVKTAADKFRKKHGVTLGVLVTKSLKTYMKGQKNITA